MSKGLDLGKLVSVDEAIDENGIKMLVHAPSGAGKTVLAATTGEPTIILSAEAGLRSLRKYARENPEYFKMIKIWKIKKLSDLEKAYQFAKKKKVRKAFTWLNLDSISEIMDSILRQAKKDNKDGRQAYGDVYDLGMDLLRKFRDLKYDVCMTCKQQYIADGDGKMMFVPLLPGKKLAQEVSYMFDEVFALQVEHEEDDEGGFDEVRYLQTGRDGKYDCKDRSGVLKMFEKPNLYNIKKKINRGGKKLKKLKKKKQDKLAA